MSLESQPKKQMNLVKNIGLVCALGAMLGCLVPMQDAFARHRGSARRNTAAALMRPSVSHLSKQQLLARIDSRERELANLWSRFIDARSRAIGAIAVTRPWTNYPTPPGPPVMTYDPVASGHAISPIYLAPGKVFQMSEASPVYRRTMQTIARNQAVAIAVRWRMLAIMNELSVLESELHNRSGR